MVAASPLDHICDELGGDGCTALVLLVLTSVGKQWDDSSYTLRARNLAGVDHNAKFHKRRVDRPTAGVDDVDIRFTDRLCYSHVGLANAALRDLRLGDI